MSRALVLVLSLAAGQAAAQGDFLQTARDAYAAAWNVSELSIGETAFVERPARLIGDIEEREDNRFAQGDEILIYAEPWGYDYIETEAGYEFGFDLDLAVLDPEGEALFSQPNFQSIRMESRREVKELFLTISLDLEGFRPGDYRVEIRANDIASEESAAFTMAFTLVE